MYKICEIRIVETIGQGEKIGLEKDVRWNMIVFQRIAYNFI